MEFDAAKKLIDSLFKYRATGDDNIFKYLIVKPEYNNDVMFDFFGGECTLYIDLMEQIVSYFIEKCKEFGYSDWLDTFRLGVESNGTTASEPKVRAFYEKYKDHLLGSVSIDGCKECHNKCRVDINGIGSYDRTVEGINIIKNITGKLPINKQTFCKDTMPYIKKSIEELYNMGYRELPGNFDNISPDQFLTPEESEQYYNYLKEAVDYVIDNKLDLKWSILYKAEMLVLFPGAFNKPICGADGSILAMKWDGSLYICAQLSESFILDKSHEVCLGNVNTGITNFELLDKLRNDFDAVFDYECFSCPFKMSCEPCPAKNLLFTGDYSRFKFNCGTSLAEMRAIFYMIKRAKETDYPYFKDLLEPLDQRWPDGLPKRNYLLYKNTDKEGSN